MMEEMVRQSNLYTLQVDITKPLNLTKEELEQFIDVGFYMSINNLPKTRMYWNPQTRVESVATPIQSVGV